MNLGTFVVLCILAFAVYISVRYLVRNGLDSCSGNCGSCGTSCKWVNDIQKAQRKIRFQKKIRQFFG